MKHSIEDLERLYQEATPGPWMSGGPVSRRSVELNGLTETVYEVGALGDDIPPGIAVINHYWSPDGNRRTDAMVNAELIVALHNAFPELLQWIRALEALYRAAQEFSGARPSESELRYLTGTPLLDAVTEFWAAFDVLSRLEAK